MRRLSNRKAGVLLLTLLSLFIASTAAGFPTPAGGAPGMGVSLAEAIANDTYEYLPIVFNKKPLATILGSETVLAYDQRIAEKAQKAGLSWIRSAAFNWNIIEPENTRPALGIPTYYWNQVNETNLYNLASRGLKIIGTIKYTPYWARKDDGYKYECGPIDQAALDEFAQFVTALIQRYGKIVKYWEFGNEPDVDPSLVSIQEFGCWGEYSDPTGFYGGGYYATMLETVYPAIKAADPQAMVLIGGLLLGCDPTLPYINCTHPQAGNFFEGILDNNGKLNGANFFDIVGFHAGASYEGTIVDENNPAWVHRGGIVLGKIDFLRSVMTRYGVNKPIMHTEGSLFCAQNYYPIICDPNQPVFTNFLEAQADYVVWYFVRNWAAGLMGTIWYRLDGVSWRYTSLLDGNQSPKPAYNSLWFLTRELYGAVYSQQITSYPGLRIYEFQSTTVKRIWVVWAPDQQAHTFDLPSGTTAALDKYGVPIAPVNNQITVNSPVYVEIVP